MQPTMQIDNSPGLLYNLIRSVKLWFHKTDSSSTTCIIEAILHILINGLKKREDSEYQNFITDLFWLTPITSLVIPHQLPTLTIGTVPIVHNDRSFFQVLSSWILDKIRESTLYSNLELLLFDKELMDTHYNENSFLKDETYSSSFVICISAIELRKADLLNLISQSLYIPINESKSFNVTHRRSSSHPQISISTNLFKNIEEEVAENINMLNILEKNHNEEAVNRNIKNEPQLNINLPLLIPRKSISLPNIVHIFKQRPRSQTVSQPMAIPQKETEPLIKSNESTPNTNLMAKAQFSFPNNYQRPLIEYSSSEGTFKESQSSYGKGAIKKILTPENYQRSSTKRLSTQRFKYNKTLKYNRPYINNENIEIHFDRSQSNSKLISPDENNTIDYGSPPLASTSLKLTSPIHFWSCVSKNIFSPKSDPILISNTDYGLSTKSNSSSIAGSFSKSFTTTTSDVLGSFVGTRDGQKLIKAHTNVFDDLVLPEISQNSIENETNRSNTIGDNQNLASLLKTNLFSSNHTDLERENAHFKISEAVISVIEHIKWTKAEFNMKKNEDIKEEITNSKCDIVNFSDKKDEAKKSERNHIKKSDLNEIVETATSYLDTKEDSSAPSTAESANEDKDYEELLESYDNILPEHVAYAEWGCGFDSLSAENVGLSLISRFNDTDLPRVAELKWLVSEEICTRYNVPQELLPIPDVNESENPDDHVVHQIQRGTRDWAPPRKQIIFTDHVLLTRKSQMQKQNYRCAGCGMRVAPVYSNRFRYCYYLGKYHCTGCHRNHKSINPAKVLKKWDFGLYPVSVFSYRLLEEIWQYPLFQLADIAPTLYKSVRSLGIAKLHRTQLKYLKDFITTCRFSQSEEKLFYEIQTYITSDPDKWSMSDFVDTKEGTLQKNLRIIIDKCEKHISNCVLCAARGFICELCFNEEPIFPWQVKVKRCDKCGMCYHTKCFQNLQIKKCRKCERIAKKSFKEKLLNEIDLFEYK